MIKFKKIFQYAGWGLAVAFFLSFLLGVFNSILQPRLISYLIKHINLDIEFLLNLILFIFLSCSFILIFIVYWLFWENRRLKTVNKEYLSKLVCPEYYRERKRLKFDSFVTGQLASYQENVMEPGDDLNQDGLATIEDNDDEYVDLDIDPEEAQGQRDGPHKVYYKSGNLKKELFYKDGKVQGVCRIYYKDGRLHQERNYKNGVMDGHFKAYDEDGVMYFDTNYKEGKQHGKEKIYTRGGRLEYLDTYEDGRKVNRKTYDDRGELKFDQDVFEKE